MKYRTSVVTPVERHLDTRVTITSVISPAHRPIRVKKGSAGSTRTSRVSSRPCPLSSVRHVRDRFGIVPANASFTSACGVGWLSFTANT